MVRFLWIGCILSLVLGGCHHGGLGDRESVSTSWKAQAPSLPSFSSTDTTLQRSITHDHINLDSTYRGSIKNNHGSGSLVMSGYFGMVDEPVDLRRGGSWQLSGVELILESTTGSLIFGPRNQHNMVFSGVSLHPLPQIVSQLHLLGILVPRVGEYLKPREVTDQVYLVSLSGAIPLTGWGDETSLTLTGLYQENILTGVLMDGTRTLEYHDYIYTLSNTSLTRAHRYDQCDVLVCTFDPRLFWGSCQLPHIAGDAFATHLPVELKWETDLATQ